MKTQSFQFIQLRCFLKAVRASCVIDYGNGYERDLYKH